MIKVLIGLGNPGAAYYHQRHSIGFKILDTLADEYGAVWSKKDQAEVATIDIDGRSIILIKPQTYMNSSGAVIPALTKKGIKPDEIMVVHDELEMPFGKIATKLGGSAKGHNGLKSIIERCGDQFYRLRFGIGRPEQREEVPHYVLAPFAEPQEKVAQLIEQSIELIKKSI